MGLLRHPRTGRVGGHPQDVHPAGGVLDDREHIQPREGDRVEVEEVTCHDPFGLGFEELPPARARHVEARDRHQPSSRSPTRSKAPPYGPGRPVPRRSAGTRKPGSPSLCAGPAGGSSLWSVTAPTEWRYLKVQRRLTRSACPRNTVAGVMSMPTHRALGSIRINAAINARSAHDKRGRGMVT